MSTITTRAGKGTPLTNTELDANFTNLNTDKLELGGTYSGGTANGVAYLNGSKVLTTGSALTFDGNNFGVGGSPTAYGGYKTITLNGGGIGAELDFKTNGTLSGYIESTSSLMNFYVPTSSNFSWVINSEQMRLTSTGLGIGTSSPASKLDVRGNTYIGASGLASNIYFRRGTDGALATYIGYNSSTSANAFDFRNESTNGYFRWCINGDATNAALTLSASGNLGLGVTPSAWSAGIKALEFPAGTLATGSGSINLIQNAYLDTGGTWRYKTSSQASYSYQYGGTHAWLTAPSGTAGNAISFTQAMTLDANSRLLVGSPPTTASGSAFEINNATPVATISNSSSAIASGELLGAVNFFSYDTSTTSRGGVGGVRLNAGTTYNTGNTPSYMTFYTHDNSPNDGTLLGNPTERMRIDSSGLVVIGGTSAESLLTLRGTDARLLIRDEGMPIRAQFDVDSTNGLVRVGSRSAHPLVFTVQNTERMRIDSSGNVGIGTSSPAEKLTVSGSASVSSDLILKESTTARGYIFGTSAGLYYRATSGLPHIWQNVGTEQMRLDSSGNLGLGVTPSAWSGYKAIQINSPYFAIYGSNASSGSTGGVISNAYYNGTNWIYINPQVATNYEQTSGQHRWSTAPSGTAGNAVSFTQAMTLDASGNLGTGTTPLAGVVNGSSTRITIGGSNAAINGAEFIAGGANASISMASGTTAGYLWMPGAYPMIFATNGSERMRLDSSGNLLVGTTTNTNSSKLVVNGTISETVGGTQYQVVSQADIGTAPNEIPVNGMLGKLAFMDVVDTVTNNPYLDTAISDTKPSLLLDFANSKTLDPRITYTRASSATYYDGKTTAVAEQNLLTYSQDFDNAAWEKYNVTIAANSTAAPDGSSTADTLTASATTAAHAVAQSGIGGTSYTISVYAKAGTASSIQIYNNNGSQLYANFNIAAGSGAVGTVGSSATASIVDAGNGWYRCVVVFSGGLTRYNIAISNSTSAAYSASFAAAGTETVYLWGAQIEARSSATAYTPTTSSPITNYIPALQTAAAGVPRFDHDPVTGESKGFLIEEQRTNLLTYSEQFDNAGWIKTNTTVSANSGVAPDGTLSADTLIANSTNGLHEVARTVIITAAPTTFSVYAKAAGKNWLLLNAYQAGLNNVAANFNLATGTLGFVGSNVAAKIDSVGNGWYRCSITYTGITAAGCTNYVRINNGDTISTYAGDDYSGIYTWGAQIEAGSFATSYIPTTSAQVTRSADAASITGANFSSWYNDAYGSMYGEFISANPTSFQITGNTSTYGMDIGVTATAGFHYNNSSNLLTGNGYLRNSVGKIAFSGDTTSRSLSLNGGAVATSQTSLITGNTQQGLKLGMAFTGLVINGTIKKLAYYPKRLSDAELQEMTQ